MNIIRENNVFLFTSTRKIENSLCLSNMHITCSDMYSLINTFVNFSRKMKKPGYCECWSGIGLDQAQNWFCLGVNFPHVFVSLARVLFVLSLPLCLVYVIHPFHPLLPDYIKGREYEGSRFIVCICYWICFRSSLVPYLKKTLYNSKVFCGLWLQNMYVYKHNYSGLPPISFDSADLIPCISWLQRHTEVT